MDWKWLFIYPELGIATVNELAAPVDTPIEFKLTSTTVMNSFYIPQLAGQIYAMPGMQTSLAAVINKPGEYDGFSSNYSGAGFSDMHFKFHGLSSADFDKWVQATRADGVALARTNYLELAKPSVREVVHHFNTVDADLFHVILNRCAEPGQMCMDKMVAYDTNRKVPDPICLPKEPVVADADRNRPAKAAAAAR
jgi:cytochrome o ubiquinol oxidase subunit 2